MRGQPLLHDKWFKQGSHSIERPDFTEKLPTSLLESADVSKIMTSEINY